MAATEVPPLQRFVFHDGPNSALLKMWCAHCHEVKEVYHFGASVVKWRRGYCKACSAIGVKARTATLAGKKLDSLRKRVGSTAGITLAHVRAVLTEAGVNPDDAAAMRAVTLVRKDTDAPLTPTNLGVRRK